MRSPISKVKPTLKIDWATHEAAKFACENWHYSKTLPVGKLVKIGAWENAKFIGAVIFAWGANMSLGKPYGLAMTECVELVRVALTKHATPVSKILSIALRFLKKQSPGIKLVVSFADPQEGHHGGIYQATNWIYSGKCADSYEYRLNGKRLNKRAYTGRQFGTGKRATVPAEAIRVATIGKHRYLFALESGTQKKIVTLSRPYPKRGGSIENDAAGFQPEEGGVNPTPSLQGSKGQ